MSAGLQTVAAARGAEGEAWRAARGDARLLGEIAMAAAGAGLLAKAESLLALLERLEPEHPAAAVARAVAEMGANRPDRAAEMLERHAIGRRKGQEATRGILLVALVAAGRRDDARRLADEVLAGPDSSARRMAATLRPALAGAAPPPGGVAPGGAAMVAPRGAAVVAPGGTANPVSGGAGQPAPQPRGAWR
ncbi:death domain-containing protein [Roseomonas sp. WA12]